MNDVSRKNIWCTGAVQVHFYPPLIPLIKIKHDLNMARYYVEIKLCINPASEMPDMY